MDSDQSLDIKDIGGINLEHYFPYQSTFNTVLYVHKRYSKKLRKDFKKEVTNNKTQEKGKTKVVKIENASVPKCDTKNSMYKKEKQNEAVLHNTIKFAKDLVPLVLAPSEGSNTPVYYTVKTCTKCKNTAHTAKCENPDNVTSEKKKPKKLIETFKKDKKKHKDSFSAESAIQTSQCNTMDDINMNQSLSYTISELSEKREKIHKNTINNKRKKRDSNKLRMSESFEGLATEFNNIDETKIKIHLMNEKEKHLLSESIREPILNAVNDCIKYINCTDMKEDVKSLQKLVVNNSQKLDNILERLASVENWLVNLANVSRNSSSPKLKSRKTSRLEQLSEDLIEEKDFTSEDELPKQNMNRISDGITVLHSARRERQEEVGCGELQECRPSTSVGVKTDRHKLPARFCWTDAERNK